MRKAFMVEKGKVRPGLPVSSNQEVLVGETGRGRTLVRVPLPSGAELDGDGRQLLSLPGDGEAVVLIKDHSGFRGGWSLHAARPASDWDAWASTPPPPGAEEGSSTHGEARRAAMPPRVSGLPAGVRVLAQGRCAQGDAGNAGGGPCYLLAVPFGAALELVRLGRLYGAPGTVRIDVSDSGDVKASVPGADAKSRLAGAGW